MCVIIKLSATMAITMDILPVLVLVAVLLYVADAEMKETSKYKQTLFQIDGISFCAWYIERQRINSDFQNRQIFK